MTQYAADALRDYQFMAQLPSLTESAAVKQRTELEHIFSGHVRKQSSKAAAATIGDQSVPYDNDYLSLQPRPSQTPDTVREFLRKRLPRYLSWTATEKASRRAEYSQGEAPEIYSRTLNQIARFIVGLVGGLSLIVPLLIMAFHSSLTKTLVTVCIAVVAFALAAAVMFQLDNKDAITATATYAAVLVVFVGTSIASRDGG